MPLKFCLAGGDWLAGSLVYSFNIILLNTAFEHLLFKNLNSLSHRRRGRLREPGEKGSFKGVIVRKGVGTVG